MADPRSLHLQGIGTPDKVVIDWIECLQESESVDRFLFTLERRLLEAKSGNQVGIAAMAVAISAINSQVRNHGMMLRIDGNGAIVGNYWEHNSSRNMMAEYVESI